ncbi:hypothetical protein LG331_09285 [Vreelandella aquamarina]|uniref:hypothetical protein n=1 Tax=Vreelandella aquamarina TaxID=77097 RepID=UPI00384DCCB7
MSAIYVNDPANGDSVSLSELARRHQLSPGAVCRRYHDGKRGDDLVAAFDKSQQAKTMHAEWRAKIEREQALIDWNTAALTRPFDQIAQASKMVGGAS